MKAQNVQGNLLVLVMVTMVTQCDAVAPSLKVETFNTHKVGTYNMKLFQNQLLNNANCSK